VIRLNRLVAVFLCNCAVVRGSISAAIILSLVLFVVISFLWMIGPEVVWHDWLGIGTGHFSASHISADGNTPFFDATRSNGPSDSRQAQSERRLIDRL